MHRTGDGIEEEPVDREVSPQGILAGVCKGHAGGVAAIGIGGVAAEGGHLDLPRAAGAQHRDHTEGRSDGECVAVAEDRTHLVGSGRCRHVVVGRRAAEQFVTNTSAGPQRLVTGLSQTVDHYDGKLTGCGRIGGNGWHGEKTRGSGYGDDRTAIDPTWPHAGISQALQQRVCS